MSKSYSFTAFGRDVAAKADTHSTEVGQVAKAVAQWFAAATSDANYSDREWKVTFDQDEDGASVTFKVASKKVFEPQTFPSAFEGDPAHYAPQARIAALAGGAEPEGDDVAQSHETETVVVDPAPLKVEGTPVARVAAVEVPVGTLGPVDYQTGKPADELTRKEAKAADEVNKEADAGALPNAEDTFPDAVKEAAKDGPKEPAKVATDAPAEPDDKHSRTGDPRTDPAAKQAAKANEKYGDKARTQLDPNPNDSEVRDEKNAGPAPKADKKSTDKK
jgi:hypothetical protein